MNKVPLYYHLTMASLINSVLRIDKIVLRDFRREQLGIVSPTKTGDTPNYIVTNVERLSEAQLLEQLDEFAFVLLDADPYEKLHQAGKNLEERRSIVFQTSWEIIKFGQKFKPYAKDKMAFDKVISAWLKAWNSYTRRMV